MYWIEQSSFQLNKTSPLQGWLTGIVPSFSDTGITKKDPGSKFKPGGVQVKFLLALCSMSLTRGCQKLCQVVGSAIVLKNCEEITHARVNQHTMQDAWYVGWKHFFIVFLSHNEPLWFTYVLSTNHYTCIYIPGSPSPRALAYLCTYYIIPT
jgi:hypothetical protein